MTYPIRLKRPDFDLSDLLIKSNRTGLQAYTAEERTFGTPCIQVNLRYPICYDDHDIL